MSAESPRKPTRLAGCIVAPQPVTDRSIIESVAGFINEVVPQGYSGPGLDGKEVITWARFEQADINDPSLYPDSVDEPTRAPPLLLVLGYANGVQVWAVPSSGEATEVLSWRQGVVRTLRILPTPPNGDSFARKRPLVALCDTASPGPQFCSLSFISLRAGDQVKSIKFKNPVNAVLASTSCVVVTFLERIAVFDACTLEDRLTVTTCYPSPGIDANPVAVGSRWLAYAERRLLPAKRCSGGTEGEGIQSYTATVLHAAKSLSKGLRELGETVASSLTGGVTPPGTRTAPGVADADLLDPGIVTILDVKGTVKENGRVEETVVAHFAAHGDAVVALQFDPSGMLLATADKRGHDFHVFRIQPHPGGSSLAAVHHLYVLHRGDTQAKVQDLVFAWDSRWLAVSTQRGTTHVFPVTPYGGPVGLRTHSSPHVVNRLSRFHRSAGLTADGRNSPQPCELSGCGSHHLAMAHANPRLPPYPHPTVVLPLAQIRQSQAVVAPPAGRSPGTRRSHAPDEAGSTPLRVSACFGAPRAWLVGSPTAPRDSSSRARRRAVDSLFVMACHGNLIQYDLETKHASGTPREKVCDDTPIEVEVQAKAQWMLGGLLRTGGEVQPPLSPSSLLIAPPTQAPPVTTDGPDERWLSQVEIVTHAGPHRRLWMGPQFTFKTYAQPSGGLSGGDGDGPSSTLVRSNPVNMPLPPVLPVLIESGSGSSYEQSPQLQETCGRSTDGSDGSGGPGDVRLREDLAEAMQESPGIANRDAGRRVIVEICSGKPSQTVAVEKVVNPVGSVLTVLAEEGSHEGCSDAESVGTAVHWPTDVIRTAPAVDLTVDRHERPVPTRISVETNVGVGQKKQKKDSTSTDGWKAGATRVSSAKKETIDSEGITTERLKRNHVQKRQNFEDKTENVDVFESTRSTSSRKLIPKVDSRSSDKLPEHLATADSLVSEQSTLESSETAEFPPSATRPRSDVRSSEDTPTRDGSKQSTVVSSSVQPPSARKLSKKQLVAVKPRKLDNTTDDQEDSLLVADGEELKVEVESDRSLSTSPPKKVSGERNTRYKAACEAIINETVSADLQTKDSLEGDELRNVKSHSPSQKSEIKIKVFSDEKFHINDANCSSPPRAKGCWVRDADATASEGVREVEESLDSKSRLASSTDSSPTRSRKLQDLYVDDEGDTSKFRRRSQRENLPRGGSKKKPKLNESSEEKSNLCRKSVSEPTCNSDLPAVKADTEVSQSVEPDSRILAGEAASTVDDGAPVAVSEPVASWSSVASGNGNGNEQCESVTSWSSIASGKWESKSLASCTNGSSGREQSKTVASCNSFAPEKESGISWSSITSGKEKIKSTTLWSSIASGEAGPMSSGVYSERGETEAVDASGKEELESPVTWSSVTSGKKDLESVVSEKEVPSDFDALTSDCLCRAEEKGDGLAGDRPNIEVDDETPVSVQLNKKSRKIKKKRR